MSKIQEMRARLQASTQKPSETRANDNTILAFYNDDILPIDGSVKIRFLPDGNVNNSFFWVEKQSLKLPFPGSTVHPNKPFVLQLPCVRTWGDACPVLKEVSPWWNGSEDDKKMASTYWAKKQYILQCLVADAGFTETNAPANPVRRVIVGGQIFKTIRDAIMNDDFEVSPDDYVDGVDFTIKKTKSGRFNDYSTSNWARKSRALTAEELSAIEQHGLFKLDEYLPKKPNEAELADIVRLFEMSVNGDLYDVNAFSHLPWKPYGHSAGDATVSHRAVPVTRPATIEEASDEDAPFDVAPAVVSQTAPAPKADVAAILARIKAGSQ